MAVQRSEEIAGQEGEGGERQVTLLRQGFRGTHILQE
jgi:hypothetical protein